MQLDSLLTKISAGPDSTILLVVIGLVLYGLVLGQNKVKTLALSVYVGIVVATELGEGAAKLLSSHLGGGGGVSPGTVKLGLFVLPLIILEFGRRHHTSRGREHGGFIMTLILCGMVAGLVVSSGLHLLGPDSVSRITGESSLSLLIYKLRLWFIALTPLAVIGENFIRPRER